MNNNEYKYYLADDHKGNKALFVVKGRLVEGLTGKNVNRIDDPAFKPLAQKLKKIIDETTVVATKGGDNHEDN